MPSPKGKDEATRTQGAEPGRLPRGPPGPPLPGTEEARLEREPKDSAPLDPQMLHEHMLREPVPRAAAGPPLLLSFSWTRPRAAAQAFAQFADPKVLHFPARPARPAGKASHVQLRFFAVVWVRRGEE